MPGSAPPAPSTRWSISRRPPATPPIPNASARSSIPAITSTPTTLDTRPWPMPSTSPSSPGRSKGEAGRVPSRPTPFVGGSALVGRASACQSEPSSDAPSSAPCASPRQIGPCSAPGALASLQCAVLPQSPPAHQIHREAAQPVPALVVLAPDALQSRRFQLAGQRAQHLAACIASRQFRNDALQHPRPAQVQPGQVVRLAIGHIADQRRLQFHTRQKSAEPPREFAWRQHAPHHVGFRQARREKILPRRFVRQRAIPVRSEEHTSELQSPCNLVCRLLLEKKKRKETRPTHTLVISCLPSTPA